MSVLFPLTSSISPTGRADRKTYTTRKGEVIMKCEGTKNCTWEVEQQKSIERKGKYYCDKACASGHPGGKGCGHQGCHC